MLVEWRGGLKGELSQLNVPRMTDAGALAEGASRHPLRLDAHSSPTSYRHPTSFPWNTTSGARPLNHIDVKIQND